jgi:hypothetical protein
VSSAQLDKETAQQSQDGIAAIRRRAAHIIGWRQGTEMPVGYQIREIASELAAEQMLFQLREPPGNRSASANGKAPETGERPT